jgi:outer membrane protein assembly factor BamB
LTGALACLGIAPARSSPAVPAVGDLPCSIGVRAGCLDWAVRGPRAGVVGREGGRAIAVTGDGATVLVTSAHHDLAYEAATGRPLWDEPNGAPGVIGGQDVAVDPSGALTVSTGEADYLQPQRVVSGDVVVTARDPATGGLVWQSRHRDGHGAVTTPRKLFVAGGSVFVVGDGLDPRQIFAAAFDLRTGAERWFAAIGSSTGRSEPVAGVSVAATPDGRRVFVTGFDVVHHPFVEWVTAAYDGATGAELWRARYRGAGQAAALPREMVLAPDGRTVYVTGWSKEPGVSGDSFDFVTIAYDTASGNPLWRGGFRSAMAGFPVDSDDLGWSVAVDPAGERVFAAGYSEDPDLDSDGHRYRVEARDARTGRELWSAGVPSLSATSDHEGLFGKAIVRSSPDGRTVYVAVSGHDNLSSRHYDPANSYRDIVVAVVAFDAGSGRFLWRGTYGAPDIEATYLNDMTVDPSGSRLYVTATALGSGQSATETAAFLTATS